MPVPAQSEKVELATAPTPRRMQRRPTHYSGEPRDTNPHFPTMTLTFDRGSQPIRTGSWVKDFTDDEASSRANRRQSVLPTPKSCQWFTNPRFVVLMPSSPMAGVLIRPTSSVGDRPIHARPTTCGHGTARPGSPPPHTRRTRWSCSSPRPGCPRRRHQRLSARCATIDHQLLRCLWASRSRRYEPRRGTGSEIVRA